MSNVRLAGKTVSFTGGFETLSRNQAIKAIQSLGATFQKQVNKNVDALVTGDSKVGIRKLQAENLGIQIIPAERFQQYLRNKQSSATPKKSADVRVRKVRAAPEAAASRFVRDDEVAAPRMPWEEEIAPRFGKIPAPTRRGRPAGSTATSAKAAPAKATPAKATTPKKKASAKTIVFAGKFNFPMSQLCKMAEDQGSSVASSMRNADLVVYGADAQIAKYRARDKGIDSMSELEFLQANK